MNETSIHWLRQSGAVKLPVLGLTWLVGFGLWLGYGDQADAFVETPPEIPWWQPVSEVPALDDPMSLGDALHRTLRQHRPELAPDLSASSEADRSSDGGAPAEAVARTPAVSPEPQRSAEPLPLASKVVAEPVDAPIVEPVAQTPSHPYADLAVTPTAIPTTTPKPSNDERTAREEEPGEVDRLERARQLLAERAHNAAFVLLNAASPAEVKRFSPAQKLVFLERYSVAALGSGRYQHSAMTYQELTRRQPDERKWWLGLAASQQAQGEDASTAFAKAEALNQLSDDSPGMRLASIETVDSPPAS